MPAEDGDSIPSPNAEFGLRGPYGPRDKPQNTRPKRCAVLSVENPGIYHAYNIREKSAVAYSQHEPVKGSLNTSGVRLARCSRKCRNAEPQVFVS